MQIVKRLLNKATNDGTDPYLGLFECRNTPIDNIGSPAQLSMSHHLRSVMPATRQVKPTVIEPDVVMERLNQKQALRKKNYDNGARASSSLQPNNKVRMQVQNCWVPANCSEIGRYSLTPMLYKHHMEKVVTGTESIYVHGLVKFNNRHCNYLTCLMMLRSLYNPLMEM